MIADDSSEDSSEFRGSLETLTEIRSDPNSTQTDSKQDKDSSGDFPEINILSLPDEVLLVTLNNIPLRDLIINVSPICRRFRDLVNDGYLWKSFGSLEDFPSIRYDKRTFDNIFSHAKSFRHLYFNGDFSFSEMSTDYISNSLSMCCNIISLDLTSNFQMVDMSFLVNMPFLEELSLEWCIYVEASAARSIFSLDNVCPRLKKLNLRCCYQFTELDIIEIVFNRQCLEELNIAQVGSYSSQSVRNLAEILPYLNKLVISVNHNMEEWEDLKREFKFLTFDGYE